MSDPLSLPDATPRLGLPFLFSGQSQRELFVNEAFFRLDMLVHAEVKGIGSDPPTAPVPGDCWIVGPNPSAAWAGQVHALAGWTGTGWIFQQPHSGMAVWDTGAGRRLRWAGSWTASTAPAAPSGGTVVDAEARAAIVALLAVLTNTGILVT